MKHRGARWKTLFEWRTGDVSRRVFRTPGDLRRRFAKIYRDTLRVGAE